MYLPPAFTEERAEAQHALIRGYPLGLLITAGPGGPMANPVPFLLDTPADGPAVLRAHMARPNPQWAELEHATECLVVFQGPQAYISPGWYPSKQEHGRVVPTWNYVTVHVWGQPEIIDDAAWIARQLDDLTRIHEAQRKLPWAPADAPPDFMAAQMRGIRGLQIPLTRTEGKWKASQNRPVPDREGVHAGLGGQADPMAAIVAERGELAWPPAS
jgi:transcriptional regulator